MNALQTISDYVYGAENNFQNALIDNSLSFEREAGFAIQILTANDYATKLAVNDRQSVVNAVTNIAAIGISLNPAKKQAYLVPRKGKICLDISYMGLIDLAIDSGSIMWAQAEIVYNGDAFALNGFDKPPTHSYNPFSQDRGDVVGAYVVVKTHASDYLTTCMSKADIDSIKNRSESVKAGKSTPWDTDYGEMSKKTVVKRAYKYWPKSDRLDQAIHHLNTEGGEGLASVSQSPAANDAPRIDPAPYIAAARATTSDADALTHWREHNGKFAKHPQDHAIFKQAVADHRRKLQSENVTDVEVKHADTDSRTEIA